MKLLTHIPSWLKNKYFLTLSGFMVWMLFFDERDFFTIRRYRQELKELQKILFLAAGNPESVSDVVKDLIKSGTAQTEKMYGYKFMIDGKELTPNGIIDKRCTYDEYLENANVKEEREKLYGKLV